MAQRTEFKFRQSKPLPQKYEIVEPKDSKIEEVKNKEVKNEEIKVPPNCAEEFGLGFVLTFVELAKENNRMDCITFECMNKVYTAFQKSNEFKSWLRTLKPKNGRVNLADHEEAYSVFLGNWMIENFIKHL
jgi:hypothetical protein